ncbi:MAG: UTP--glucose-1-phosphate uridylyltransferase [Planctomycetota bacterium]|jgi:UDP-N-acetylglucosamine/UDP-N-acetylgalactosamine diphosphorylase
MYEDINNMLKKHRQSHLLAFWDLLDTAQRQHLLSQIQQLDLAKIDRWVADYVKIPASEAISVDLLPVPFYSLEPSDNEQEQKYTEAVKLGKDLIRQGKVAAFVVAGGQGTRLGFDGPKGDFPISPVKNKTLFQIFAEYIAASSRKYNTICPWYIMTSPLNHATTEEIFRSNNYYGLDEKNIFVLQQGTMPNFSPDGKVLLADKANLSCSPDGHGGSLKALYKSGAIEDMKRRGVEFISYFQVDNPLINIFDPLFIGLHALDKAEMSSRAVIKIDPFEGVGNFCLAQGRLNIIEYSDLPDELAERKNQDGSLTFKLGSIAIHIINRAFIERLNADGFSLPLHRALKRVPHIDERGEPLETAEPNGVKLESFVFDAVPLASKSIILETLRPEEFAPTKNATGIDSVETTRKMMVARAASWLESAGLTVPKKPDGSIDCVIEIAPGFALYKEDIKEKLNQIPQINPGDKIYLT